MTDEMYVDFPIIEHDFMAHCGTKLKEFDDVCWYDQTYIGISQPVDVMYSNVLRLIYNGANLGDSYCLELIKSLYKTYYKKKLVNTAPVSSGNIHEYRKEIHLQQTELAEMVGVHRETIGKLENGKYNPSLKLAMDIAKVFGKSVEEVFEFPEEED